MTDYGMEQEAYEQRKLLLKHAEYQSELLRALVRLIYDQSAPGTAPPILPDPPSPR